MLLRTLNFTPGNSALRGASFDGMTDVKSYHDSLLANPDGTVEAVHFGADFIFAQRKVGPERHAEIVALIEAATGEAFDWSKRWPSSWNGLGIDWNELRIRGIWFQDVYHALAELERVPVVSKS